MRNDPPPLLDEISAFLEPGAQPPGGVAIAHILTGLAACEVEEGGPYASVRGGGRADVDLGMNLVIALFLHSLKLYLPKLDAYIQSELAKPRISSKYCTSERLASLCEQYQALQTRASEPEAVETWTEEESSVLTEIRDAVERRFRMLPKAFADTARHVVNRTITGNKDKQMSLMPLYMRQALGRKGEQFSDAYLAELGLSNIFFWTAFIVYDDFWDVDEAADPKFLPAANLFARHYTQFFSNRAAGTDFNTFFHTYMDSLDAANEWEVLSCRLYRKGSVLLVPNTLPEYDDFSIKFFPAAGHIFGPVLMLLELGYSLDSAEVQNLIDYFRHYLIAMQLNDDLHDWKEDLMRGHISTAVSCLLSAWRASHLKECRINLVEDMPELEQLFWKEVLPTVCETVRERAARSQQALEALVCIENLAPLMQFVTRNRSTAEEALAEHGRSTQFISALAEHEQGMASSDFL